MVVKGCCSLKMTKAGQAPARPASVRGDASPGEARVRHLERLKKGLSPARQLPIGNSIRPIPRPPLTWPLDTTHCTIPTHQPGTRHLWPTLAAEQHLPERRSNRRGNSVVSLPLQGTRKNNPSRSYSCRFLGLFAFGHIVEHRAAAQTLSVWGGTGEPSFLSHK